MRTHYFDHETLDVYKLFASVARWYVTARFPRGTAKLEGQGWASCSHATTAARLSLSPHCFAPSTSWLSSGRRRALALNVAEGRARKGHARISHRTVPRRWLGLSPHRAAPDVPRWQRPRPPKPAARSGLCSHGTTVARQGPASHYFAPSTVWLPNSVVERLPRTGSDAPAPCSPRWGHSSLQEGLSPLPLPLLP